MGNIYSLHLTANSSGLRPVTLTVMEKMLKLQLEGINPYLVTVFALMGVL